MFLLLLLSSSSCVYGAQLLERLDAVQHSNRALDRTKGDVDIDSHHGGDDDDDDDGHRHHHHNNSSSNNGHFDGGSSNDDDNNPNNSSGHQLLSEITSTLRANSQMAAVGH